MYRVVKLLLCNYNNLFDCDYEYEEVDDRYIYFIVTRKKTQHAQKIAKNIQRLMGIKNDDDDH